MRGLYGMTIFRNRSESVRNFEVAHSGGGRPVAVARIDPMVGRSVMRPSSVACAIGSVKSVEACCLVRGKADYQRREGR